MRGNSSFYLPKKSYRLELQRDDGKDRKISLLGMPADSDWVLYASVTDRTFVRNLLGHELWRRMGRYAVNWRFVEVFVVTNAVPAWSAQQVAKDVPRVLEVLSRTNAEAAALTFSNNIDRVASNLVGSYMGIYVLMEKIKRGKERVNIARLRPEHTAEPKISGGYIIKKDDPRTQDRGLLTGQEFKVRYEEPKENELTAVQRQWMTRYLDDFEKALFGLGFREAEHGYRKYLDVDSFIDFHWLVEVAKNADGYWFSQYMHKDRGGKLTMGPVWDWDNAFGNPSFPGSMGPSAWRFETAEDPDYTWYRRLFEDPDFLQRYVDRWSELRTNVLVTSNLLALIDQIGTQVKPAEVRNSFRWPPRTRQSVWTPASNYFEEEVNNLKDWITRRLAWIDKQDFPKPVAQIIRTTNSPPKVAMAWLSGRLFYTTNGTDPRLPGGLPASHAREYAQPVPLPTNVVVTARVRSEFGLWSAPIVMDGRVHDSP